MNKLLEFQKRVTPIVKDSENPYYKSKYFDINSILAEIRPILNDLGLIMLQPLQMAEFKPALETRIIDAETGKELANSLTVLPENTDPQKMGAIITYFRRYAIQSMLCLEAEDDDAQSTKTNAVQLLKVKLSNDGATSPKEALEILENKTGVRLKSIEELNEKLAKELITLYK